MYNEVVQMDNTTLPPNDNGTDDLLSNYSAYGYEATLIIDRYVTPVTIVIGLPGNVLSLLIWMQRRMRHSSGYYLAALALNDLLFLILHIMYEVQVTWGKTILDKPVLCEAYPIIFLATQYLSPFLVLAFTSERYISICHPFKREKYCTVKRAKIVIVSLTVFMLCLTTPYGYFFTLESDCTVRAEIMGDGTRSVYSLYSLCVEMLAFLVVPITILALNILVIIELKRLTRMESAQLHGSPQRTAATTVMLLAVSFYQIITTLPVSIVYSLFWKFSRPVTEDPDLWSSHYTYLLVQTVFKEYGITHYAFNFFIYLATGKMFRQELKRLLLRPFAKLGLTLTRDYSSLRTSVRTMDTSRTWVSTNGNHKDQQTVADETLL
ncbi:hypothetical protein Btru_076550 [Bulinus truncatus]|nr:hypothetical protein Btru_076550 [Bulinus truncatus]